MSERSPERATRMRRIAARVLPSLGVLVPLAVLAAATATLYAGGTPRWGDFAATAVCAALLAAALRVLARIRRRHPRELTTREAVAALALAVGGLVWAIGTLGIGLGALQLATWFVHGMFASAVATAVLLWAATRRDAPPAGS